MPSYNVVKDNMTILKHFMYREWLAVKRDFIHSFINSLCWPSLTGITFGYIMPLLGLGKTYAGFMLVGSTLSVGIYTAYSEAWLLSIDFDTDRKVDFEMTLPWPLYMLVLKNALRIAFITLLRILPLPFITKLIVYEQFSFAHISPLSVLIILPLATLTISMGMACGAHAVRSRLFMDFRLRIVDQLFFLGCYMFPWAIMYKALPRGAYISLLNPVVHMMEATRAAFFGQEGFLPFWISCAVLVIEAMLFFTLAIYLFKRRLDTISA